MLARLLDVALGELLPKEPLVISALGQKQKQTSVATVRDVCFTPGSRHWASTPRESASSHKRTLPMNLLRIYLARMLLRVSALSAVWATKIAPEISGNRM